MPIVSRRAVNEPIGNSNAFRIKMMYGFIIFIVSIFFFRLFYLQIIKHSYYKNAALSGQLKEYEIRSPRGTIEIQDGNNVVPLVLNEKKYTLFADPKFVKDIDKSASSLIEITGGDKNEYKQKLKLNTRYSILAKKLNKNQAEAINKLDLLGIGLRESDYRTYPEGSLAAQLLGFVNDEGKGSYGIEQALDKELSGSPGQVKAITDARGVPLAASGDNVLVKPKAGKKAVLTVDLGIQKQTEDILKAGLEAAKSKSGSIIIMEADTGAVKAMANYPSYNPAEFEKVEDGKLFVNEVVSGAYEIGSVMKPLIVAAGLDKGVIEPETTYYDPGFFRIDDATITNVSEVSGSGTRSIKDILQMSLNTGAVFVLRQLGGGEINEQARKTWHDYMLNHYRFGRSTGIEQGYESDGSVPSPVEGYGLGIQYANTSFGQGVTVSPLQLSAALSSVINGGNYWKPRLVDKYINHIGNEEIQKPELIRSRVVNQKTSKTITDMMKHVVDSNLRSAVREGYIVGGKTGTAQIPKPEGGYYEDKYNGSYLGFVGINRPQYVIMVRVNEPGIAGYAGSRAAGPVFSNITNMLIDSFKVKP